MKTLFTCLLASLFSLISYSQSLTLQPMPTGYNSSAIRYVNGIAIDQNNNTWVAFEKIGIGKYDGSAWTMYDTLTSSLPTKTITGITVGNQNQIIASTYKGVSIFDGNNWQHFDNNNSLLPASGANCIAEFSNTIYAGTKTGLYIYNGTSWTGYTTTSGLVDDSITAITASSNGDVWIGTRNGISKFSQGNFSNYSSSNTSLADDNIKTIAVNGSNEPWIINKSAETFFLNTTSLNFENLTTVIPFSVNGCDPLNFSTYLSLQNINGDIVVAMENPNPAVHYNDVNSKLLLFIHPDHTIDYSYIINQFGSNSELPFITHANGNISYMSSMAISSNSDRFYTGTLSSFSLRKLTSEFIRQEFLDINEVSTLILNRGDMHWDPVAQRSYYEVPECTGKQSVYTSALWLGGYDQNNVLHTAAQTYRQSNSSDFWPGPIDTISGTTDSSVFREYDRLWKINKSTIDDFIVNYQAGNVNNGSYKIPFSISEWPAHGSGNLSRSLAPFHDNNFDNIYNPMDGDYPLISGDQQLWWVFNDVLAPHTETNGLPFGFEIHAKAYAFNCNTITSTNEPINYSTFYQYKIINRSQNTYHDMYIGLWTDNDIGNAADDYVKCHVPLNAGICYNGDADDDASGGYGLKPPSQSISILKGPLAPASDGIDNNNNSSIDEPGETIGMSHFIKYDGVNSSPVGIPSTDEDYYQYMNGLWLDGVPITYGANGRDNNNPVCNYLFPENSDPAFPSLWTMATAGITAGDMKYVMSSGKFTIAPGEIKTIDFVYIYSRDTVGNWPADADAKTINDIYKINYWYNNNLLSSCPLPASVSEVSNSSQSLTVYPTPAEETIRVQINNCSNCFYSITDIAGHECLSGYYDGNTISVRALAPGVYQLKLNGQHFSSVGRFIKK